MGDDSSDIQVGSLIALLAESGEDWKNIQSSQPSKVVAKETQQLAKSNNAIPLHQQEATHSKHSM